MALKDMPSSLVQDLLNNPKIHFRRSRNMVKLEILILKSI